MKTEPTSINSAMAAGFAASEVAGLIVIFGVVALATGRTSWVFVLDVLLLVGVATWLWWSRSPVAARWTLVIVASEMVAFAISNKSKLVLIPPLLLIVAFFSRTNDMKRYIMAAGFAASEVAGLMMLFISAGALAGKLAAGGLFRFLFLGGSATWLWWSRNPVAARFTLAAVVSTAVTAVPPMLALVFAVLFIVAFFIHAMLSRKKLAPSESQ